MNEIHNEKFASIETIQKGLRGKGYISSKQIATSLFLSYNLSKPILIEGPAGVGKTELAKTTAALLDLPLIRLQCYEGLDESKAIYEWKYGKQLLYTQMLKEKLNDVVEGAKGLSESIQNLHKYNDIFFSTDFLEPRPILKAIQQKRGAVLLLDEIDKSDDEFEAFLLEILSDFQVSIPEIGTIQAVSKPFVFLTSNNTREMSDALKRRCLHLFIPFPEAKLEREIIRLRIPYISESLMIQLVSFIQQVRELELKKLPSISEVIDWAKVLLLLNSDSLNLDLVKETLNVILKFEVDIELIEEHLYNMIAKAKKEAAL